MSDDLLALRREVAELRRELDELRSQLASEIRTQRIVVGNGDLDGGCVTTVTPGAIDVERHGDDLCTRIGVGTVECGNDEAGLLAKLQVDTEVAIVEASSCRDRERDYGAPGDHTVELVASLDGNDRRRAGVEVDLIELQVPIGRHSGVGEHV